MVICTRSAKRLPTEMSYAAQPPPEKKPRVEQGRSKRNKKQKNKARQVAPTTYAAAFGALRSQMLALLAAAVPRCGVGYPFTRAVADNGFLMRTLWNGFMCAGTKFFCVSMSRGRMARTPVKLVTFGVGRTLGIVGPQRINAAAPYDSLAAVEPNSIVGVHRQRSENGTRNFWVSDLISGHQWEVLRESLNTVVYGANSRWILLYDWNVKKITLGNLGNDTITEHGTSFLLKGNTLELPAVFLEASFFFNSTALDQAALIVKLAKDAPPLLYLLDLDATGRAPAIVVKTVKTWYTADDYYFANGYIFSKANTESYVIRMLNEDWSAGDVYEIYGAPNFISGPADGLWQLSPSNFLVDRSDTHNLEIWDIYNSTRPVQVVSRLPAWHQIVAEAGYLFVETGNAIERFSGAKSGGREDEGHPFFVTTASAVPDHCTSQSQSTQRHRGGPPSALHLTLCDHIFHLERRCTTHTLGKKERQLLHILLLPISSSGTTTHLKLHLENCEPVTYRY
ncbi:hypothetical protein Pelo_4105 [Pelomyxa schiedti]|nr:hypothetical protein Pelo_4105 [Pelomyxa schiedti]